MFGFMGSMGHHWPSLAMFHLLEEPTCTAPTGCRATCALCSSICTCARGPPTIISGATSASQDAESAALPMPCLCLAYALPMP